MVSVLSFTGREVSGSSISSRVADRVAMRSAALSPATENSPWVRPVIQVIPLLLVQRKNTNSSPWFSTGEPEKLWWRPLTVPPGVMTSTEVAAGALELLAHLNLIVGINDGTAEGRPGSGDFSQDNHGAAVDHVVQG